MIYQTVRNYRSGHSLNSGNPTLLGRRLGNAKDERWRLVKSLKNPSSVAVQKFITFGQGVVAQSNAAVLGSSPESNTVWTVADADMNVPDGRYLSTCDAPRS